MGSNPDQKRVREALKREDLFTVVMEQFPTDTVDYADIVLPATMQTEHLDVNDGYGHMYVSLNRPAVEPPGECVSTTETFRRIARAMGLNEPPLYDDDETCAAHCSATRASTAVGRAAGCADYPSRSCRSPTASRRRRASSSSTREHAQRDGLDPLPGYTPPGARAGRGPPAGADRARLALVPEHDLRQQAGPDASAPAARG